MTATNIPKLSSLPIIASDRPFFLKEKHVSYWSRCLRSLLPHQYTQSDSNRMTLAFFVLSALDVLDVLFTTTTSKERADWVDWIYTCQCPDGGFCGYPIAESRNTQNSQGSPWNPASVPATYFALGALSVLRDDLARVRRKECLSWLRKTQRPDDGSFGELLGDQGNIEGGWDSRYGYCAMVVRWILRDNIEGDVEGVPDIDVEALVRCIRRCETYDGGLSDRPFHEAHAGYTYCAVGALSFLNRLPASETQPYASTDERNGASPTSSIPGLANKQRTVRWLLSCLTTLIEEEDEIEDGDDECESESELLSNPERSSSLPETISSQGVKANAVQETGFVKLRSMPASQAAEPTIPTASSLLSSSSVFDPPNPQYTAFAGRVNKFADTCYAFWVGASLKMLDSLHLIDAAPLRRFLLGKAQHLIAGGFGKTPTDPPDIYHSYLALAILSILLDLDHDLDEDENENEKKVENEDDQRVEEKTKHPLSSLDASLCMTVRAKEWLQTLEWRKRS